MMIQPYILLVDDDPQNLFLLEELLEVQNYTTRSALSGSEALHMAQHQRPQLILLDVMMPGMDGFEVCERLRADPNLQTVPILFLTALDDDESRLKGLTVMGDDYLTKPIQTDLVLTKIASILRLHEMRQASHQRELSRQTETLRQQALQQVKRQMMATWRVNEALSEKFHLFVPEQFLRRIAPQGLESIQLGNVTEAEMTILFCDIRQFTSIAESQQAQATFTWLNAFFSTINQAIMQHHGFIDKYLGDAVMAVFDQPDHIQDGLKAAIAIRTALIQFNQERHQFNLTQPINIGIGLHSGTGIIGTLGSNQRMDTTIIGDVVNTASRLEEITKVYGCAAIASGTIVKQLPPSHPFCLRWIDQVMPRGKQQAVDLYEIMGTQAHPLDDSKARSQTIFQQGILAWQQQQYLAAANAFRQVIAQDPTDTVASLYYDRCQRQLRPQPERPTTEERPSFLQS